MIDYQTYCQIRHLFTEKRLGLRQIARQLKLGLNTVRKWARRESYRRAPIPKRPSKLDPFKGQIVALLEQHDYSAQQILQRVKEQGYPGRYTILRAFVQQVRPKPRPAFLTLHFEPGECAQVDWGCAGSVPVGSTQRRLSFFIMVLAFSRKMYLEFTLAETLEHFLAYRVKEGSPALALGFTNFPMDQFGVTSERLRRLARTPKLPVPGEAREAKSKRDSRVTTWLGAKVKNIIGLGEVSAAGLPGEMGVSLLEVPAGSAAAKARLEVGDVILKCAGKSTDTVADLERRWLGAAAGPVRLEVWRGQKSIPLAVSKEP